MNQLYNIQLSCDIVAKGRPPPSSENEKEKERESVSESDKEGEAERGNGRGSGGGSERGERGNERGSGRGGERGERGNESESGSQRMQITVPKYCYNIEIVESSVGGEEGAHGGQGNSNVRTCLQWRNGKCV